MYSKKIKRFKRIYIEITNICNMNCSFCPKSTRYKEYMSLNNFENILIKIKDYTDYIYLHVKGEPLMHNEISEILDLCKKYKLRVNITTNGTLIKEKEEILKNSDAIRQINISLHSFEDIENISTMEKLFGCIKSAKYIKDNSNIIIAFRLWNIKNDYLELSDLNKICIQKIQEIFEVDDINEKLILNNNIRIKDKVFLNMEYQFDWPNIEINDISDCGSCYGLREQIAILVDGTIVPCCLDNNGDVNLGNILKEKTNFEDILNSKRVENIIQGFKNNKLIEDLCRRCGYIRKSKFKK